MINHLFEFAVNHYLLVGTFVVLLIAFLINEGKQGGAAVTTGHLVSLMNKEDALVLDVRDQKEFAQGHIAGSLNIPFTTLNERVAELEAYKDKPVVLVCKMGQHAGAAGRKLKSGGFNNVRRLTGGMAEWTGNNLPIVKGKA